MMMMGGVGVKDIIFASTEGFLGGGLFIYIYISPSSPERGRLWEEGKERGYKGTLNKFFQYTFDLILQGGGEGVQILSNC